jgi:hypothetical protein
VTIPIDRPQIIDIRLSPQFADRILVGMFDDPDHFRPHFCGQRPGMKIFLQPLIRFHCPFVKAFMALGFLFSDLLAKGHE